MPATVSILDAGMEDALETLLATGPFAATSASDLSASDAAHESDANSSDDTNAGEDASNPRARVGGGINDVDYAAMLQEALEASDSDASQPNDDDDDDEADGNEADVRAGQDSGALLPCEDDFLKLSDMDAFVRQAEAAEELGDRGGLAEFDVAREGAEAAGELGSAAGAAWARRRRAQGDADDSEDGDSDEGALGGGDVDLFGHFSDEEMGGDEDGGSSGDEGAAGVMHDDFFGAARARRAGASPKASRAAAAAENDETAEDTSSGEGAEDSAEGDAVLPLRGTTAPVRSEEHLSSHERRTLRIQEQIAAMEEAAMGGAEWHMRGEASAASRPVDSALAMDLDFEQTMRAPPQPTAEAALALDDLIKARIREMRFDNVVRVAVAAPRKERAALELDDTRSKAGLADVYEEELSQRVGGAAADKKAQIRMVRRCRSTRTNEPSLSIACAQRC